jgi:hypothetical protein
VQAAPTSKSTVVVEELCRGTAQVTCAVGNVVICLSDQTPDKAYLEAYARAINRYGERHPSGLGMLVLIAADEPPPDEQARRAIHASHIAVKGCVRLAVLIVEGTGFGASAKRSIIAMLSSLSPTAAFPTKVTGTIQEGAAKLAKLLGPHLDPQLNADTIAAAVTRIRNQRR